MIAVDPADARHLVVSSNDFAHGYNDFFTTFDGGRTWSVGAIPLEAGKVAADPSIAFDPKDGRVLHAGLNTRINFQTGGYGFSDVVVSSSADGGLTWGKPVVVVRGHGFGAHQLFNDKPFMTTDTNPGSPFYGRTYLVWVRIPQGIGFSRGPEGVIEEAQSDDGGITWSRPRTISGSSRGYCTFRGFGGQQGACDQSEWPIPTITPDGTVVVAFTNEQNQRAWDRGDRLEDQFLVVSSRDGGAHWSSPVHVVNVQDGTRDFPLNRVQAQTLTSSQITFTAPAGNIVNDPRDGRLYLVFADNRAGRRDVPAPRTNTRVYVMTSRDGTRWRGPFLVSDQGGDQWFPWAAVNPRTGHLGILYYQRLPQQPGRFETILADGTVAGFHTSAISPLSKQSPSLWYRLAPLDPFGPGTGPCSRCTAWIGDYIGLAYGADGSANAVWTGMRVFLSLGSRFPKLYRGSGYNENIFFVRR
jgi:hypothetical protein